MGRGDLWLALLPARSSQGGCRTAVAEEAPGQLSMAVVRCLVDERTKKIVRSLQRAAASRCLQARLPMQAPRCSLTGQGSWRAYPV